MIVFTNIFEVDAPMQIRIQIDAPDPEGWRKYHMSLVANSEDGPLVDFDQAFSDGCMERLIMGMTGLIDGRTDEFEFEPIEPAFRMKISRSNTEEFDMLCIVDINFVRGGAATETGIGMAMVIKADEVKRALAEIS